MVLDLRWNPPPPQTFAAQKKPNLSRVNQKLKRFQILKMGVESSETSQGKDLHYIRYDKMYNMYVFHKIKRLLKSPIYGSPLTL